MDIRYQVFISSTFADLKEERSRVIQTVMELDCIPAGMEIFPAIDEEQFNFIKKVIDDCDYYLLIIGGRYGALSEEGISYTEMEYNYAIEKGIKVIAFIHEKPNEIPLGKSETDQAARLKLEKFRQKVSTDRLVKFWSNAKELPGLVALSLPKTIKTYPAIGWIRANSITNPESFQELNNQIKENNELKQKINELLNDTTKQNCDLADLGDYIEIFGFAKNSENKYRRWSIDITLGQMFSIIAPYLLPIKNDDEVKRLLIDNLERKSFFNEFSFDREIDSDLFETIKIQFRALGLVTYEYFTSTGVFYWHLTETGESAMIDLRAFKKSSI